LVPSFFSCASWTFTNRCSPLGSHFA
jgi:hypothetical protein